MTDILIETHPLEPFMPSHARVLMLGSFPPQKKRWSMNFYYPNLNNDMWRIMGLIFFDNKDYFLNEPRKAFCRDRIIAFLLEKGIALFDTASVVRRLQDNASDKFLEVMEATDIGRLLNQLSQCKTIIATGQKATDILLTQFKISQPEIGSFSEFVFNNTVMRLYRMPSTSRAYPLVLEKKAEAYRKVLFKEIL
ncbi:hypothetical protein EZS27_007058 [termite gut metagenome]|uniref:Uracil-DNA glycosylase-like domain-containing protein n=1 Tax=termite gut metagenome TaxID=433724 RepID=A0A5J4SGW2_9ZZZZ